MLQRNRTVIDYVETEPGVFEPAPPARPNFQRVQFAPCDFTFDSRAEDDGAKIVEFYQPGPMLKGDWSQAPTATGTTINRTAFFLEDLDGITGGE